MIQVSLVQVVDLDLFFVKDEENSGLPDHYWMTSRKFYTSICVVCGNGEMNESDMRFNEQKKGGH